AFAAVAVVAAAATAARGAPVLAVDDVGQGVGAGGGADDDRATVAAVAAVGAAARHVLLPAETARAGAAVAAFDVNCHPVHEHEFILGGRLSRKRKSHSAVCGFAAPPRKTAPHLPRPRPSFFLLFLLQSLAPLSRFFPGSLGKLHRRIRS